MSSSQLFPWQWTNRPVRAAPPSSRLTEKPLAKMKRFGGRCGRAQRQSPRLHRRIRANRRARSLVIGAAFLGLAAPQSATGAVAQVCARVAQRLSLARADTDKRDHHPEYLPTSGSISAAPAMRRRFGVWCEALHFALAAASPCG